MHPLANPLGRTKLCPDMGAAHLCLFASLGILEDIFLTRSLKYSLFQTTVGIVVRFECFKWHSVHSCCKSLVLKISSCKCSTSLPKCLCYKSYVQNISSCFPAARFTERSWAFTVGAAKCVYVTSVHYGEERLVWMTIRMLVGTVDIMTYSETCLERPLPWQMKDHMFLAEGPTFQYYWTCHQRPPAFVRAYLYGQWGGLSRHVVLYCVLYTLLILLTIDTKLFLQEDKH